MCHGHRRSTGVNAGFVPDSAASSRARPPFDCDALVRAHGLKPRTASERLMIVGHLPCTAGARRLDRAMPPGCEAGSA